MTYRKSDTLGDGNCAYNAMVLCLVARLLANKDNPEFRQGFDNNLVTLTPFFNKLRAQYPQINAKPNSDALLDVIALYPSKRDLQIALAPLFRQWHNETKPHDENSILGELQITFRELFIYWMNNRNTFNDPSNPSKRLSDAELFDLFKDRMAYSLRNAISRNLATTLCGQMDFAIFTAHVAPILRAPIDADIGAGGGLYAIADHLLFDGRNLNNWLHQRQTITSLDTALHAPGAYVDPASLDTFIKAVKLPFKKTYEDGPAATAGRQRSLADKMRIIKTPGHFSAVLTKNEELALNNQFAIPDHHHAPIPEKRSRSAEKLNSTECILTDLAKRKIEKLLGDNPSQEFSHRELVKAANSKKAEKKAVQQDFDALFASNINEMQGTISEEELEESAFKKTIEQIRLSH